LPDLPPPLERLQWSTPISPPLPSGASTPTPAPAPTPSSSAPSSSAPCSPIPSTRRAADSRRPANVWIAGACLAALALAACEGASDGGISGGWSHESETLGDTVVVRTIAGSVWGDTMVLVPEVAIGEAEGEEPYLLGQPTAMVLDAAGHIHVLDRQAREVRTFGPDGRHVRSFGSQGQGPGEFTSPDAMRLLPDGRLVIRDQQGARFSIFDSGGAFVDSWPIRSGFSTSTPFQVVNEETGPGTGVRVSNPSLADTDASMDEWRPVRVRYLVADPAVQDTLQVPTSGFEATYLEVQTENSRSRTTLPFSRRRSPSRPPRGDPHPLLAPSRGLSGGRKTPRYI
jgi:hypothetical protein